MCSFSGSYNFKFVQNFLDDSMSILPSYDSIVRIFPHVSNSIICLSAFLATSRHFLTRLFGAFSNSCSAILIMSRFSAFLPQDDRMSCYAILEA